MMKKKFVMLMVLIFIVGSGLPLLNAEPDFSNLDIKIGNIRIPRAFIHAGKDYAKGSYNITLTAKEGVPYFNVFNAKNELLFEEMAVLKVKDYKGTAKVMRHRVRKEMLRGYEYFRIQVSRPDALIMAYLLVKPQKSAPTNAGETPAPKKQVTELL